MSVRPYLGAVGVLDIADELDAGVRPTGVDDLDGSVQEEKIYHVAGSSTPDGMTTAALSRLVRSAGREPLERRAFYNVDNIPQGSEPATLDA